MHYEERLMNGVLMYRNNPAGAWKQCGIEIMSRRIITQEEEIKRLTAEIKWLKDDKEAADYDRANGVW